MIPELTRPASSIEPFFDEQLWRGTTRQSVSARLRGWLRINEIGVLTIVSVTGYVLVAFWIRYDLHFWINDALSRSADAVYVTVGRDPHLGAIGFYWPPLPQLIQIPLVPFLLPFGQTQMAGPLSSAICVAVTIPVLARIGRLLGLGRGWTLAICLTFAVNPVIIYYAAIGMSEACFFLVGAVTMLGFLGFVRTRGTPYLLMLAVGLTGCVLTRLEGPFLAIALAVVAGLQWGKWRQSARTIFLIGLPAAAAFFAWMLVQWVLLGSPFFFEHQSSAPR